ncbi:endonuclease domain-containing protein [Patescibacteria group bacterium]|nr:endonuclease domain-containing protein [Patescibacteria group bacterium]MBU1721841.1 endonuclease domain-containing protein [Patescibacteria group bacterium]MBU1901664.1 endonuclease domain-containing protein [Patescibacteria group bacterium]
MENKLYYQNQSSTRERRKLLRKQATKSEQILWQELRGKQLGIKFRRQYNIDYYIVDFYCHELRLILEIDGNIHGENKQRLKDIERQTYLEEQGYTIVRYRNEQILNELDIVLEQLWQIVHIFSSKDPT